MTTKLFVSTPCFLIPQLLAPHECLNLRYMPVSSQLSTAASRFRVPKKRITGREDRNSGLNWMATVRANVESAAVPTSVPVRVAHELLQAGHRYLDVRTAEEFSAGHAVGAINVPYMFKVGSGMTKNPTFLEEVLLHFGKDDEIIVAMQHAHSFSMKAFETREELAGLKREFALIHKQNRALQIKMKKLEDQAEAAIKAKQIADEKADAAEALKNVAMSQQKEAEEKAHQAQKELEEALATKEADLKAADAQAYQQGMDAVAEDYKLQVMQACNKGFVLGWNALSKELNLPADSPWRKTKAMRLPCPLPPSPTQVEEETESEAEAEDEGEAEDEALVRKAKSPSNGEQILDLTGDEDLEAAPKNTDIGTLSSDLLLAVRSVDETLAEIDAEVAADKAAEVPADKETEVQAEKVAEVVEPKDAEEVLPESSEVPPQPTVQVEEI